MSSHHRGWTGIAMAFASAICFSTLAIFVKLAFSHQLSVTTVVVLRMTLASVFLWLTRLLTKRERWKISRQDWLILLAAIGIALYTVYSQRLLKNYSPLAISAWTLPPVGIVFALLDWNTLPRYTEIPIAAWLVMLGAAVVGTYIALLLYFGAVVRIGATRAALICTIEPVSTTLQATWILGERMTPWQMLGAALILGGLAALEWPNGGERREKRIKAQDAAEFAFKEFRQRRMPDG